MKSAACRSLRRGSVLLGLVLTACSGIWVVSRTQTSPGTFGALPESALVDLRRESPYLKAHMMDGRVYVLASWARSGSGEAQVLEGVGALVGANCDTLYRGTCQVRLDSVLMIETNELRESSSLDAITVLTGVSAIITVACLSNPKACFGSCPTFYLADGDSARLQAEGFSASVAPHLEATDVDALFRAAVAGDVVRVEMRNEALETHVVRQVDLLAAPRARGSRILADSEGQLWESTLLHAPVLARGSEGSCLELIAAPDGVERFSRADSTDLSTREIIELEFESVSSGPAGLVIGCRQALLTTYLLYQTFAYMGQDVAYWFAEAQRSKSRRFQGLWRLMGGLEVLLQRPDGEWVIVGQVDEYGPLATDFHLVSLGALNAGSHRIRLRLGQGSWRIDYVALAALAGPVQGDELQPRTVLRDGVVDESARAVLCDPGQALVTLPGDTYTLEYQLPDSAEHYELFLVSRGYYLEWIRKEWVQEHNPRLLAEMANAPHASLRRLAPQYKRVESQMEESFWKSRYAAP